MAGNVIPEGTIAPKGLMQGHQCLQWILVSLACIKLIEEGTTTGVKKMNPTAFNLWIKASYSISIGSRCSK